MFKPSIDFDFSMDFYVVHYAQKDRGELNIRHLVAPRGIWSVQSELGLVFHFIKVSFNFWGGGNLPPPSPKSHFKASMLHLSCQG